MTVWHAAKENLISFYDWDMTVFMWSYVENIIKNTLQQENDL